MTESREVAYQKTFDFYIGRLSQVEAIQTMNRLFAGSAVLLAIATDKPALWVGLGVAVVDATINEFRLRRVHNEVVMEYHGVKNSIYQALSEEKKR